MKVSITPRRVENILLITPPENFNDIIEAIRRALIFLFLLCKLIDKCNS